MSDPLLGSIDPNSAPTSNLPKGDATKHTRKRVEKVAGNLLVITLVACTVLGSLGVAGMFSSSTIGILGSGVGMLGVVTGLLSFDKQSRWIGKCTSRKGIFDIIPVSLTISTLLSLTMGMLGVCGSLTAAQVGWGLLMVPILPLGMIALTFIFYLSFHGPMHTWEMEKKKEIGKKTKISLDQQPAQISSEPAQISSVSPCRKRIEKIGWNGLLISAVACAILGSLGASGVFSFLTIAKVAVGLGALSCIMAVITCATLNRESKIYDFVPWTWIISTLVPIVVGALGMAGFAITGSQIGFSLLGAVGISFLVFAITASTTGKCCRSL
ncbi:MAG: hypothetical protein R3E91_04755 [Chlamydiales bacterium]